MKTGYIEYEFVKPRWNGGDWVAKSFNSTLEFNSSKSSFSYNKLSMLKEDNELKILNENGFGFKGVDADSVGYLIYRDFLNSEILLRIPEKKPLDPISVKDDWVKINWTKKKSKKSILGYSCQLAIGEFRGRVYEVWFTDEIPLPYGPWKLYGLPGIIVEATDLRNQIKFTATEICYPCELSQENLHMVIENEHLSMQSYVNLQDNLLKEVELEMQKQIDSITKSKGIGKISIELNNEPTEADKKYKRKFMPEIIFEWENNYSEKVFKN